jgi:hypothetical protein
MSAQKYVVRVVYKTQNIELHEYAGKKKALAARDDFRRMETVQSAKMMLADDARRLGRDSDIS